MLEVLGSDGVNIYSEETAGAYNSETDKFDKRKIKVECPECKRKFAALCSKSTKFIRCVDYGYEYHDWVSMYSTVCGRCGHKFVFGVGE